MAPSAHESMTAEEFLAEVGSVDPEPSLSVEDISELSDLWKMLTDALNYQDGKWQVSDEDTGDWRQLAFQKLHDVLYELGVGGKPRFEPIYQDGEIVGSKIIPDPEREKVIREFLHRDRKAHARSTDDLRRAQLRFGFK